VTVTYQDTGAAARQDVGSAEIIIIDCSGSMRSPRTKIEQARAATAAAVDVIRDGVAFAVIAGTEKAVPIFPADGSLVVASPGTKEAAKQAVSGVLPRGGTAIGQWLRLALAMFSSYPASLRHGILLTDGQNAHETPEDTATAKLGRAVALAEQSGNEDTAKLLAKVVDVVDAASGTVHLKKKVDDADEMALDTRSTKTVRTKK
jgi:Mg-chelatase subunit ChlD